jgi:hypothetical protein
MTEFRAHGVLFVALNGTSQPYDAEHHQEKQRHRGGHRE